MSSEPARTIERVLVVDDNEQNRLVAEGNLVAAGYDVVLAADGHEALALFEASGADLVLLDILMPGIDGFETCRRLRALPGGPDTPVVFLTALTDLGTHEQALASGADDFLTKPINRTELLMRVRSLLRIRRLHQKIQQDADVIRAQHAALLRTQQLKADLSALLVHDLKNPLAEIQMNARYLLDEPNLSEPVRESLRDALGATDSLLRMVMNLLDVSRSEDGALVPRVRAVDVAALVERASGVLRRRVEDRRQRLVVTVPRDGRALWADPDLLVRVLENLLENSVKYGAHGGQIAVEARFDGADFALAIADDGPGVPPEFREKVFDKYARLDRAAGAHARTSRGLGLLFCRLAVEAHGGRIWVEDNAPRGARFCVRLPASPL